MIARLEKIIPSPDSSFVVFKVEKERFDKTWHYHPEIELIHVQEGKGDRYVGDDISPFGAGDLVLLGPELPHVWRSSPAGDQELRPNARATVLQFVMGIFGSAWDTSPELTPIRKLIGRAQRGLSFSKATAAGVVPKLDELTASNGWRRLDLLLQILGTLSEATGRPLSSAGFRPELDAQSSERIAHVITYISENFSNPLTLSEVSKQATMSPSAFCRYFQRVTASVSSSLLMKSASRRPFDCCAKAAGILMPSVSNPVLEPSLTSTEYSDWRKE